LDFFVDKIENNIAELHLEDNQIIFISTNNLPENIKEGDYLNIKFSLNNNLKEDVKNNVKELFDELSDNSGGDFEL